MVQYIPQKKNTGCQEDPGSLFFVVGEGGILYKPLPPQPVQWVTQPVSYCATLGQEHGGA